VARSGCRSHQGYCFFLISWATIVIAFALLLGFVNVITVHVNRIRGRKSGAIYSAVLLVSLLWHVAVWHSRPTSPNTQFIFEYILQPLEATFFALLALFIATAAFSRFSHPQLETFFFVLFASDCFIGTRCRFRCISGRNSLSLKIGF